MTDHPVSAQEYRASRKTRLGFEATPEMVELAKVLDRLGVGTPRVVARALVERGYGVSVPAEPGAPDPLAAALATTFAYHQQPATDGSFAFGEEPTSYWRDRAENVRSLLASQPVPAPEPRASGDAKCVCGRSIFRASVEGVEQPWRHWVEPRDHSAVPAEPGAPDLAAYWAKSHDAGGHIGFRLDGCPRCASQSAPAPEPSALREAAGAVVALLDDHAVAFDDDTRQRLIALRAALVATPQDPEP